jgi:hypothetical protein
MDILKATSGKAMIIDVNDKLTLKNIMKRRRQKVVELIRMVYKASVSPGIIATLLKEKRRLTRSQTGMAPKSYENLSKN